MALTISAAFAGLGRAVALGLRLEADLGLEIAELLEQIGEAATE
jgi:hypothetical protein